MNFRWLVLGLLVNSCRDHLLPVAQSAAYPQDTARALPAATVDTVRPAAKAKTKNQGHPVRFIADLNSDQLPDTITIVSSIGDAVTFDTVHISIAHFDRRTFYTDTVHSWTTVDDRFARSNRNVLPTNKLFLARGKFQSVLLLFGDLNAAGYRENFSIIHIEDNSPKLVLSQNERNLYIEPPVRLEDLDGDGRLEFLYRQIFEYSEIPDTLNGKIGTYSPYFIYTVDSSCTLNQSLTRRYNEEHYVFAGYKYDEGIKVYYPNDGSKPRLWEKK
jgi:hypothetical protein